MKILVCSIIRNQERNLSAWIKLLRELNYNRDISISVFENDSTDRTKEILLNEDFSMFTDKRIIQTTIGSKQYGSIWNIDRIKNLAFCRNSCLDGWDLSKFDKIAFIEPDIDYDPKWCGELLDASHPKQANIIPHIYSGWSLRSLNNPKESTYLYDTCATRQKENDICWNFDNQSQWINSSLIKTNLGGIDGNCLHSLYSTFNCFCVYDAIPFRFGARFGHLNKKLNPSNIFIHEENGFLESDTCVIVDKFRELGFSNILINTNCLIRHLH